LGKGHHISNASGEMKLKVGVDSGVQLKGVIPENRKQGTEIEEDTFKDKSRILV